ncbi:MAG: hypothetical protein M3394_08635 [Actinomycetota bacterium]|nr:hypothetical protein [Actinomycetota bacterium]
MTNEERAAEAVEHLQAAAREMIAAARVLLDLAEEVVDNPGPVLHLLGELAAPLVARGRAAGPERDDGAPPKAPRVQHIRVS